MIITKKFLICDGCKKDYDFNWLYEGTESGWVRERGA